MRYLLIVLSVFLLSCGDVGDIGSSDSTTVVDNSDNSDNSVTTGNLDCEVSCTQDPETGLFAVTTKCEGAVNNITEVFSTLPEKCSTLEEGSSDETAPDTTGNGVIINPAVDL